MNPPRMPSALLMMIVVLLGGTARGDGQELIDREAEIKAGVVASLGKFVTWPEGAAPADASMRIGVLGKDPFVQGGVNHLERKLAGQTVVVQRFATSEDYQPCHILVVARSAEWDEAVARTQGQHVLLLGEAPGLAKRGAVINLVVEGDRIVMEINPDAAKDAGLTIAPSVYRLPMVRIVR